MSYLTPESIERIAIAIISLLGGGVAIKLIEYAVIKFNGRREDKKHRNTEIVQQYGVLVDRLQKRVDDLERAVAKKDEAHTKCVELASAQQMRIQNLEDRIKVLEGLK